MSSRAVGLSTILPFVVVSGSRDITLAVDTHAEALKTTDTECRFLASVTPVSILVKWGGILARATKEVHGIVQFGTIAQQTQTPRL